MLKGKEFGAAIGVAIKLKIASNPSLKKAHIASHFKIKPPSITDWVKKGSVAKDKLPELWRYFSDVVGPEHWGMTKDEWPAGLITSEISYAASDRTIPDTANDSATLTYPKKKTQREKDIDDLLSITERISDRGLAALLFSARQVAEQFPKVKQTPKSSA